MKNKISSIIYITLMFIFLCASLSNAFTNHRDDELIPEDTTLTNTAISNEEIEIPQTPYHPEMSASADSGANMTSSSINDSAVGLSQAQLPLSEIVNILVNDKSNPGLLDIVIALKSAGYEEKAIYSALTGSGLYPQEQIDSVINWQNVDLNSGVSNQPVSNADNTDVSGDSKVSEPTEPALPLTRAKEAEETASVPMVNPVLGMGKNLAEQGYSLSSAAQILKSSGVSEKIAYGELTSGYSNVSDETITWALLDAGYENKQLVYNLTVADLKASGASDTKIVNKLTGTGLTLLKPISKFKKYEFKHTIRSLEFIKKICKDNTELVAKIDRMITKVTNGYNRQVLKTDKIEIAKALLASGSSAEDVAKAFKANAYSSEFIAEVFKGAGVAVDEAVFAMINSGGGAATKALDDLVAAGYNEKEVYSAAVKQLWNGSNDGEVLNQLVGDDKNSEDGKRRTGLVNAALIDLKFRSQATVTSESLVMLFDSGYNAAGVKDVLSGRGYSDTEIDTAINDSMGQIVSSLASAGKSTGDIVGIFKSTSGTVMYAAKLAEALIKAGFDENMVVSVLTYNGAAQADVNKGLSMAHLGV